MIHGDGIIEVEMAQGEKCSQNFEHFFFDGNSQ